MSVHVTACVCFPHLPPRVFPVSPPYIPDRFRCSRTSRRVSSGRCFPKHRCSGFSETAKLGAISSPTSLDHTSTFPLWKTARFRSYVTAIHQSLSCSHSIRKSHCCLMQATQMPTLKSTGFVSYVYAIQFVLELFTGFNVSPRFLHQNCKLFNFATSFETK